MVSSSARDYADAGRLTHLLWEVHARASSLMEFALSSSALSPSGQGILDVLSAQPGSSIADITRVLPVSAQNASQLVARLERLGLLERRLGSRGRGVALFLSPAGERERNAANESMQQLDAQLAVALGDTDHRALVRLLERARPVFERLEQEKSGRHSARDFL